MISFCQACRTEPSAIRVDDDDPDQPYLLCSACCDRLRAKALRPLEWFNLAAIHGWRKYLLHDDFYDQDGIADQPKKGAGSAVGPPAPSLRLVENSLERLTDYCVTRWCVEPEAYEAFASFPSATVLKELDRRTEIRNWHILKTCLGICAHALGKGAADWVRTNYQRAIEANVLISWSEAAAECLPPPEGVGLTMEALEESNEKELRARKMALMWFRSPEVLDWIEARVPSANITEDWGLLAALSALDWKRAKTWLEQGRPMSLVSIDALSQFIERPGQSPVVSQLRPKLRGCEVRSEIRQQLSNYMTADDTPRVVRKCEFIIKHLDELRLD